MKIIITKINVIKAYTFKAYIINKDCNKIRA